MEREPRDRIRTWAILAVLAAGILALGIFLWAVLGDRGAPPWDFGAQQDVPGQSPYSTRR